jgi:hypothetical protein
MEKTMAKKKKKIPPETWARWAETERKLEERAAYHGKKADEEDRRRREAQP